MSTRQPNGERVPSMVDVMKNPDFLKLWMAQVLSQTAQQVLNFALILQVRLITGSNTAVAGIIISFTVPSILFAAIAGVFVERHSKKTVLVVTNAARGLMVLAYIFTDPSWGAGAVLPILYTVTFLFSAVSQFFSPAEASKIPLVVKREELLAANSLFNLTLTGTALGGFVVVGPILLGTVLHNNFSAIYILIAVLCLAPAVLTYFLPHDVPIESAAGRESRNGTRTGGAFAALRSAAGPAWEELKEGWAFIRKDAVIMGAIFYWSIAIAIFMMLGAIGLGFLENQLGIDPSRFFIILVPGGIGLVLGVLFVGRWATPDNRESMINRSLLMAGITLAVFAVAQPMFSWIFGFFDSRPPDVLMLGFIGLLTLLLGVFNSFISVPAQTALQERSPEEVRARVFSAFYTVSNTLLLVPVALAGPMADSWGYVYTLGFIALVVLAVAVFGLSRARKRTLQTSPLSAGMITTEEVEAALTVGSPAPHPIPAGAQQTERVDRKRKL